MLKKTITYENFNGEMVSEDHFFHLSKADLVEMEVSHKGGLSEALEQIVKSEDGKQIIAEFKKLVLGSYGKKSDDGRRFIKSDALREEFVSSEAYSTLFMELVTDADKAAEFVNGIIPSGMDNMANKIGEDPIGMGLGPHPSDPAATPVATPGITTPPVAPPTADNIGNVPKRVISKAEAIAMDSVDLANLLTAGKAVISSEG